jgi:cytochrome c oxidase subunit 1
MFVSGQPLFANILFSGIAFLMAVPLAVIIFNWTATLYKGSISYRAPILYAFASIGLLLISGIAGLLLSSLPVNVHLHDTHFVVAHSHYMMMGSLTMAYLAALHFWWPKMTGRMYPAWWGRLSVLIIFGGVNLTFLPQFLLGYFGMPRRYNVYPAEFQVFNVISITGVLILAIGLIIPLIYFLLSLRLGAQAGPNPWAAKGLEWETDSPPPAENFKETPAAPEEAYAYSAEQTEATV